MPDKTLKVNKKLKIAVSEKKLNRSIMKNWIKGALILTGMVITFTVCVYEFYINKPTKDIEKLIPDFTVNTQKLYKEYTTNKDHSDSIYKGRVIEISGKIDKVEIMDSTIVAVFVFSKGDFGDAGIRCMMLPKYNDEIKKVSLGSKINIKGYCSGINESDVILEKCSLIKDEYTSSILLMDF